MRSIVAIAAAVAALVSAVLASAGVAHDDVIPPTSSASVAAAGGGEPPCTRVGTVTFVVADETGGSGAAELRYRVVETPDDFVGPAQHILPLVAGDSVAAPFAEGDWTLAYWGVDRAGNEESPRRVVSFVVDRTRPGVALVPRPRRTRFTRGERAILTVTRWDEGSGLARSRPDDPFEETLNLDTTTERLATSRPGRRTIARVARDRCGNTRSARFTFTVVPRRR